MGVSCFNIIIKSDGSQKLFNPLITHYIMARNDKNSLIFLIYKNEFEVNQINKLSHDFEVVEMLRRKIRRNNSNAVLCKQPV